MGIKKSMSEHYSECEDVLAVTNALHHVAGVCPALKGTLRLGLLLVIMKLCKQIKRNRKEADHLATRVYQIHVLLKVSTQGFLSVPPMLMEAISSLENVLQETETHLKKIVSLGRLKRIILCGRTRWIIQKMNLELAEAISDFQISSQIRIECSLNQPKSSKHLTASEVVASGVALVVIFIIGIPAIVLSHPNVSIRWLAV